MNEYYLDQHTSYCEAAKSRGELVCRTPERFLFFLKTKFVMITYNSCMECGGHLDFKQDLVKRIIGDNKVYQRYEVDRINVSKELKEFRLHNRTLKENIAQVNYLYSDNAGKQYAIVTYTDFMEAICNQEEIEKNYEAAKTFLIKNEFGKYYLNQLHDLFISNVVWNESEAEYVKTTDHLIKEINNLINQ